MKPRAMILGLIFCLAGGLVIQVMAGEPTTRPGFSSPSTARRKAGGAAKVVAAAAAVQKDSAQTTASQVNKTDAATTATPAPTPTPAPTSTPAPSAAEPAPPPASAVEATTASQPAAADPSAGIGANAMINFKYPRGKTYKEVLQQLGEAFGFKVEWLPASPDHPESVEFYQKMVGSGSYEGLIADMLTSLTLGELPIEVYGGNSVDDISRFAPYILTPRPEPKVTLAVKQMELGKIVERLSSQIGKNIWLYPDLYNYITNLSSNNDSLEKCLNDLTHGQGMIWFRMKDGSYRIYAAHRFQYLLNLRNPFRDLTFNWLTNNHVQVRGRDYQQVLDRQTEEQGMRKKFAEEYVLQTQVYPVKMSLKTAKDLIIPAFGGGSFSAASEFNGSSHYLISKDGKVEISRTAGSATVLDSVLEKILSDEKSNSLIVTALPATHEKIKKILDQTEAMLSGGRGDDATTIPQQFAIEILLLRNNESSTQTTAAQAVSAPPAQTGLKPEDLKALGLGAVSLMGKGSISLAGDRGEIGHASLSLADAYDCELQFQDYRPPYVIVKARLKSGEKTVIENTLFVQKDKPSVLGVTNLRDALVLVLRQQ